MVKSFSLEKDPDEGTDETEPEAPEKDDGENEEEDDEGKEEEEEEEEVVIFTLEASCP